MTSTRRPRQSVCFDLDGTLIDVRWRHYALYSDICRELEIQPLSRNDYWAQRGRGMSNPDIATSGGDGTRQAFLDLWLERIESEDYLRLDTPLAGAAEALDNLRSEFSLHLITLRSDGPRLRDQLSALDIDRFFDLIVCRDSRDVLSKLDLVDQLPAEPRVTAVVGDSEADVELAHALNAPCIGISVGVRSVDFLKTAGCEQIVDDLEELPAVIRSLRSGPVQPTNV